MRQWKALFFFGTLGAAPDTWLDNAHQRYTQTPKIDQKMPRLLLRAAEFSDELSQWDLGCGWSRHPSQQFSHSAPSDSCDFSSAKFTSSLMDSEKRGVRIPFCLTMVVWLACSCEGYAITLWLSNYFIIIWYFRVMNYNDDSSIL